MSINAKPFLNNLAARIEIELRKRIPAYQDRCGLMLRQAAAAGAFCSGNTVRKLVELAITEQQGRIDHMLSLLALTWTSFEAPAIAADQASTLVRQTAQTSSNELFESVASSSLLRSIGGLPGSFLDILRSGLQLAGQELELRLVTWEAAIKNAKTDEQIRQRTVVNLTGNHNIVQAGTMGSSLSIELRSSTGASLQEALVQLREEISHSAVLSEEQKKDHVELVGDCLKEVERKGPNTLRLSSLLQGMATSLQIIGATCPAYETVKAVARLIGIPLP